MELRWISFVYCIKKLSDARFILLNRRFKPLGVQTYDHVDYENHPSAVRLPITPAIAKSLSWEGSDVTDEIYLYDNNDSPTENPEHLSAYLERLAILMKLRVIPA